MVIERISSTGVRERENSVMSKTWVVIPAAGESRRFKTEGYRLPKPVLLISWQGKILSMVEHVIASLPSGEFEVVVVLPRGVDGPRSLQRSASVGHIRLTNGQADTVLQIVRDLPTKDKVLVMDCDMILRSEDIFHVHHSLWAFDLTVAVTKTFDPNASRVDRIPHPELFVEKEPISEWGIVGLRGFRDVGCLTQALETTILTCNRHRTEPYLSMAMNYYPGTRYAHQIFDYQDWGTPERLRQTGAYIVDNREA